MTAPWEDHRKESLTGTRSEPLWHQLFSPDSKTDSKTDSTEEKPLARLAATARSHSAFDWGTAGDIDVEDLTASRTQNP